MKAVPCAAEFIAEVADLRMALVDNLNSSDSQMAASHQPVSHESAMVFASCQPATPEPVNPQMSPFLGTRLATMTASRGFCRS